jgi:hypothetical protein
MFQILIRHYLQVLCLALIAAASAVAPPAYAPAPEVYPDAAPVYSYQYGVADDYSKAAFSQQESRDGYATSGEYRVNLPDGRVQIVSYTAGPEGYVADVKYEGEAAYPEAAPYKPAPYKAAPAPAYKAAPAPAYKPVVVAAPVYHKPAPVYHKPAPVYHKPAPVYHAAPAYHKPAPAYHAAPAYHKPAA